MREQDAEEIQSWLVRESGIRSVAPALELCNAVLLKPDPRTCVCGGVALVQILREAGLPDGLLQLLPDGRGTGEAAVTAPEVRVVSFTGSDEQPPPGRGPRRAAPQAD